MTMFSWLFVNLRRLIFGVILLALLPVLLVAGKTVVQLFSQAAPTPANIEIDVNKYQAKLSRPWEGVSQGGEQEFPGKLVSLAPVVAAGKKLGVRYVRIDHVLEEPFSDTVDERVKEILDMGATPIISLSYFPKAVAGSDIGTPRDWSAWNLRVRDLVERVSGRGNLNLAGVYYEVWNEPDGPSFGNFSIGTGEDKDYWTLYKNTVAAVENAENVNEFYVGGPALADLRRCSDGLLFVCRRFWIDRFFELVSENKTRLDFVSWHRYSLKMSDYEEDTNFLLQFSSKYASLPHFQKLITEWGSDPARSPLHNGVFDAAHLVAAARTFIGYVDLATKFELRDGPESKGNGWGLIGFDGTQKPAFEALTLLSQLKENRVVVSGEGTFVKGIASRDDSGISFILVNYDKASTRVEKVPIRVNGLEPGVNYKITRQTIGRSLNPEFTSAQILPIGFSGIIKTTETMFPNSVVFYLIERSFTNGG